MRRLALARILLPWPEGDQRELARLLGALVDRVNEALPAEDDRRRRRQLTAADQQPSRLPSRALERTRR